jgi:hypothetical protein
MAITVEIRVPGDMRAPVLWPDPEQTGQPGPHTCAGELTANPNITIKIIIKFLHMNILLSACLFSEGPKFARIIKEMTEELSALGPNLYRQNSKK